MEDSVTRAARERERNGPWEVEISYEAQEDLLKHKTQCLKNVNHVKFIPVGEFNKEHLPDECKDDDIVRLVQATSALTVRLLVEYVSDSRPETFPGTNTPYPCYKFRGMNMARAGTGWVWGVKKRSFDKVYGSCPCNECIASSTPKSEFVHVYIRTATHVVFDDLEAARTTCHLFFDDGNSPADCEGAVVFKGTPQVVSDAKRDYSLIRYATHDMRLADRITSHVRQWDNIAETLKNKLLGPTNIEEVRQNMVDKLPEAMRMLTIIVSHPHGCSKQVTVGLFKETVENDDGRCSYRYTTDTCPGSSGAKVLVMGKMWWNRHTGHVHSAGGKGGLNYSGLNRDI